jgi:long-chain acyl-CoA synthetase
MMGGAVHTFADPLARANRIAPDGLAVVCDQERLTYRQLNDRCRRLAGGLRGLGLVPGDRVAVVAGNSHRYLELYLAVPADGMVIVPLNARHAEAELRYALEDSGTRVLVTDRDPGALAEIVERVIMLPDDYEKLIVEGKDVDLGEGVTEDTLAGLFYTGGTTGASKGVMLSHRNLVANAFHSIVGLGLTSEDRSLIMAPMFHAAGTITLLANIWLCATQVITPFEPSLVLDLVEREAITSMLGVPTMLAAVSEEQLARPRDTTSVGTFVHGGSPIASEVLRRAHAAFPCANLIELYGATELGPLATVQLHEERILDGPALRSCGQPVAGVDVRIFCTDGTEAHPGQVGEVAVRGPNVLLGYWNKPAQTGAALVNGWYRSGDLGYMDEVANLYLVDRAKDMIISGGENVYSSEVEEALYSHPMVLEAAVFGIPDDRWGERVHAAVVPRGPVTVEDLVAHCRDRIAGYKVPKAIDLRDEALPKSAAGKILKRELRRPYWEGRDSNIA